MFFEKVVTSVSGLGLFFAYFLTSCFLLSAFCFIYERVTPYGEFKLISGGNTAAAASFCGAMLGYTIPLASAVIHSVGLLDMIVWGIVALLVQLATFFIVKTIFPSIIIDIPNNQVSKGIFLGLTSLAVGILNAACMTY